MSSEGDRVSPEAPTKAYVAEENEFYALLRFYYSRASFFFSLASIRDEFGDRGRGCPPVVEVLAAHDFNGYSFVSFLAILKLLTVALPESCYIFSEPFFKMIFFI